ncbi:hypothetical protein CCR75_005423 [Bremia lactucae]|uniref:LNR domain-containing protein n=1 Tax=Bremia lactucae TaxID=4779 RepID=A0A976IDU6_BRELC|nr:hypothetical protein CCR75_005423 [Bremia lactucae]
MSSPQGPSCKARSSCYIASFTFFLGVFATYLSIILSRWKPLNRNNIGNVNSEDFLSYGPIDVVYTWVNGTDPRWKKEKEFWHKHWIASLTGQPLPVWGHEADVKGKDDSNADNRFRDNEELRYSLRSLEKYAPWVRHIYVVTDGQIPSWLDIESPRLSIIKHQEIFTDPSDLPVFSSPAIEWNLANIPGLSDMFLYFNDDVFLGAPVRPEDFVSQAGVQKAYFAWEIPLCADRCFEKSLGNGMCDQECNVTACDFDMGDCGCDVDPLTGSVECNSEKVANLLEHAAKPRKISDAICEGMCYYSWLGNGVCDRVCNVSSCAFDGGECQVPQLDDLYQYDEDDEDDNDDKEKEKRMSSLIKNLWSADIERNHTLVHVPLDVNATYLNLTTAFGVNSSITNAAHDNSELIRFAVVYEMEMVLVLVFGRNSDGNPLTNSAEMTVRGEKADGSPVQLDFSIVRGNKPIEEITNSTKELSGGAFTFQNISVRPHHVRLPFGFRQATFHSVLPTRGFDTDMNFLKKNDEPFNHGQKEGVSSKLSSNMPLVEVFLPLNVTGKELKEGDVFDLAWALDLRLHGDEDIDWSVTSECRFIAPKEFLNEATMPSITDVSAPETQKNAAFDKSKVYLSASEDGVQEINPSITEAKPKKTQDVKHDDSIPKCRLAEHDRGIIVTVRIITNHAFDVLSAAGLVDNDKSEEISPDTPKEAPSSAPGASAGTDKSATVDQLFDEWKRSPQVTDGHICFYDSKRADPWRHRYCFALAMSHYHSQTVEVVHKPTLWAIEHPPKPQVVYTPYTGNNPALLELLDHCIDTTERFLGLASQTCLSTELPISRPKQEEKPEVDLQKENEEEGRRLACEAQKQRMKRNEKKASSNFHYLESFSHVLTSIQMALGLGFVVPATESVEYADVCDPVSPTTLKSPSVTLSDAQAHLSTDTFGDSLRYVNKLYNRAFGKPTTYDRRRVPSHMPFLLQKSIIREIKDHWTHEIDATSSHRFRHPEDMQFSFSYFHYLINRAKIHPHTLEDIWHDYLDANRNGILDENEVLTAASLARGDAPPEDFVTSVRECIQPKKREKVREVTTAEGIVRLHETLMPFITLANLEQCPSIRDALIQNVRYEKMVELMPETEVTFHMLSDDFNFAWKQMMGTRARRTKFVCINDDMKFPTTRVSQILHELFLSIWPKRSQFELPYHLKNRYAHRDDYDAANQRLQIALGMLGGVLLVLMAVFRKELREIFRVQTILRASQSSIESNSEPQPQISNLKTHCRREVTSEKL